jgi:hypothetical protein
VRKHRAPSSPVFPLEPKRLAKRLIDYLIHDVAKHADVINSADAINIEAGKEDLEGNVGTIFRILDGLPNKREREAAFLALYRVINGTHLISKSGIYPIGEMQHSYGLQAAMSRAHREQKTTERDEIIQSVIDETEKRDKLPKPKQLLDLVNAGLKAAGKIEIKIGTLYRFLERRRHS